MSTSGLKAADDCISKYNDLKLQHKYKYIVYALNDNKSEIIVQKEELSDAKKKNEDVYAEFLKLLPKDAPRYAVFDFEFEKADGAGKRSRICFITWSPDSSDVKQKMVYATSKGALRKSLVGIQVDVQASEYDEVDYNTVLEKCDKLR